MIENSIKKRIQSFDIARTFAILCVVLCHSVETAYSNNMYMLDSGIIQWFKIICFTIGRLGVPIFLFLTGALILKKQIDDDDDVNNFYKKNLLPLFITIEIWNIIYNQFLSDIKIKIMPIQESVNITNFLKDIFFLKQVSLPHMWYLPVIIGIYLALPFVAKIVKSFSMKSMKIPMIIVFISTIVLPSINIILNIFEIRGLQTILDLNFLGGAYGLYIILGYYIDKGLLKKVSNKMLIIVAFLSFIITCVFQNITFEIGKIYLIWYNFITLFICTICIFELFARIKNKDNLNIFRRFCEYVSKISLGIFFMHEIVLILFTQYTQKIGINNILETFVLFGLTTICSIIIIKVFSEIKFIKEKLFLIKE